MVYAIPSQYGGVHATVQARDLCVIREELASAAALPTSCSAFSSSAATHRYHPHGGTEAKIPAAASQR